MFIVPCKFDPTRPVIYECVRSIRDHHPNEKILVVDSASEDKTYFHQIDAEVIDADNTHYAVNGYYIGFQKYPDEDHYFLLYDSLFVRSNLDEFRTNKLTTVRHFKTPPTGFGFDETGKELWPWANSQCRNNMGFDLPQEFTGVFGPMWFCNGEVMRDLERLGLFKILPQTKFHLSMMERLVGVALGRLGYDPSNSLQGEMVDFYAAFDNTYIEKTILDRA